MIEVLSFMNIKDQHKMMRISSYMRKLVSHLFKESFQRSQHQTLLMFPGNKIFIIGEFSSSGTQDIEIRSISDSNSSCESSDDEDKTDPQE